MYLEPYDDNNDNNINTLLWSLQGVTNSVHWTLIQYRKRQCIVFMESEVGFPLSQDARLVEELLSQLSTISGSLGSGAQRPLFV